jgi:hypothetical protein
MALQSRKKCLYISLLRRQKSGQIVMKMTRITLISIIIALTCIPNLAKANSGDFDGGVAIGTGYAGTDTAPSNGLIVQGSVGIGTSSPAYQLDVRGTAGSTIASNGAPVINKLNVVSFTSSGTYTPSSGMQYATIECWGGGGGGGGVAGAANQTFISGGGGAGAYCRKTSSVAAVGASQTVTIGAAGSGGAAGNHNGGNGGETSVGSLCVSDGGSGGQGTTSSSAGYGGAGGTSGSGDIAAPGAPGENGQFGSSSSGSYSVGGGNGGSSLVGAGGINIPDWGTAVAGGTASGYAAGGGGASATNTTATEPGGAGTAGYCIITEYISN